MDFSALLKLLPTIVAAISSVRSIITLATSNADIVVKLQSLFPAIAELLSKYGAEFFPSVKPQLQSAAAAVQVFGQDIFKAAQIACNRISPLLGLPDPKLEVDGIFGPLSQAATKKVQEALKVQTVDGWWGALTDLAAKNFEASKVIK